MTVLWSALSVLAGVAVGVTVGWVLGGHWLDHSHTARQHRADLKRVLKGRP